MDTKKAVKDTGEVETPVTTPPVVEQKPTPEVVTEVPETAEKPDETPETDVPTEGETELPEDKSEQGRAFAEMRRKIKELEEQVEEKKTRQSSFDNIRTIAPQPQYVQVDQNRFYDSQGQFHKPEYDAAVQQANIHNQQVSSRMAAETVEYKLDEWNARQKFPALNTNRKFERAVASEYQARLLETISDPAKPTPRIEQIAAEYAPYFATDKKNIVKETTEKVKQQLTEKEQASLSATGRSQPPIDAEELQKLRVASRYGDKAAIVERFRRIRGG